MKNKMSMLIMIIIPVLIILAILVYVIYFLVFEMPKNKYDKYSQVYEKIEVSDEDVVNRYVSQISDIFKNNDLSQILSILDIEDEKYAAMGSGDLLEELSKNNVLGNNMKLIKYEKYDTNGNNKIYDTYVKFENNDETKNIVIKENYPDEYTIILGF